MINYIDNISLRKIVIFTYKIYPCQSPRCLRGTELAIELARRGHNVTIYALTDGYDYSEFEAETNVRVKSLGKTRFFKFDHKHGLKLNVPMKIFRTLFGKLLNFPDIELVFNVNAALKKEKEMDLLITIAKPYPLHWGAALFKTFNRAELEKTIWVADCGDPYMGNPFDNPPFYFKYVEKWFCKKADFISVPIVEASDAYYEEFRGKVRVIPQGFDFVKTQTNNEVVRNEAITFIYAGTFNEGKRDPRPFLDYLSKVEKDFKFIVYTNKPWFFDNYQDAFGGKLEVNSYIPRQELIKRMSTADFLLNIENPSPVQSPSKLIDYSLAQRPILSLNTNTKLDVGLIDEFLSGNYKKAFILKNIDEYNIRNVAEKFLNLTVNASN